MQRRHFLQSVGTFFGVTALATRRQPPSETPAYTDSDNHVIDRELMDNDLATSITYEA